MAYVVGPILFLLILWAVERADGRSRFVIYDGRVRWRSSLERDGWR